MKEINVRTAGIRILGSGNAVPWLKEKLNGLNPGFCVVEAISMLATAASQVLAWTIASLGSFTTASDELIESLPVYWLVTELMAGCRVRQNKRSRHL